ncbi:ABC transporter ATP-binding protein [Hutsoniella sourekii]
MVISIQDLSYAYGSKQVLQNLNVSIQEGEFTAILGVNGAGKTTLFRCLLGLIQPQKGIIKLMGHSLSKLSLSEVAELVAYVPQEQVVSFNHLVIDWVEMGAGPNPGPKVTEKALACLAQLGIEDLALNGYLDLSGGQRQLVRLAQGLMQETPILILDEPTNNLDYGNQLKILAQCQGLTRQGYTIVMTSHNPQDVLYFCDRALILQEGRIQAQGPARQVLSSSVLSDLYDVEVDLIQESAADPPLILPNLKEL